MALQRLDAVGDPAWLFTICCIVTTVAATALVWWLATLITEEGLGSGLWLLILAPMIFQLSGFTGGLIAYLEVNGWDAVVMAHIAHPLLATFLVVAVETFYPDKSNGSTLLWPTLFLSTFGLALILLLGANELNSPLANGFGDGRLPDLNIPIAFTLLCVLTFLFVYLEQRRAGGIPISRIVLRSVTVVAVTAGAAAVQKMTGDWPVNQGWGTIVLALVFMRKIRVYTLR